MANPKHKLPYSDQGIYAKTIEKLDKLDVTGWMLSYVAPSQTKSGMMTGVTEDTMVCWYYPDVLESLKNLESRKGLLDKYEIQYEVNKVDFKL
jgi:hypothetical protein